jgi:hypothetical protein
MGVRFVGSFSESFVLFSCFFGVMGTCWRERLLRVDICSKGSKIYYYCSRHNLLLRERDSVWLLAFVGFLHTTDGRLVAMYDGLRRKIFEALLSNAAVIFSGSASGAQSW